MITVPCHIAYDNVFSVLLGYHGIAIGVWVDQEVFHHVIALVDVVADGVLDPVS